MNPADWISTNTQLFLGACVLVAFGVVAAQLLSELTRRLSRKIFGEPERDKRQQHREDELHALLGKVLERQTCQMHPQVITELQKIEQEVHNGDLQLKAVDKHMRWTGRCIWMIGRELKITDLPDEPEVDI